LFGRADASTDYVTSQRAEKMMTKTIRAGVAIAAMLIATIAAQAADLPRPSYKAPAYSEPAYANWTGFYVGLNAGYGFGTSNWDIPAVSPSPKGILGGLTLGYNFQTGSWLWGVEGDIDYSGMKGSTDCPLGGTCDTKNSWLGTGRGRIGYTGWNNWLPYLTAGIAMGDIKASDLIGSATKMKLGWTAGVGIEYALWTNWSVKAEYLYVDLGEFDCTACTGGAVSDNVTFKANLVRLGVNYRF
jgi:outer membrane immunogenic protein